MSEVIPPQLRDRRFRFVLVTKRKKAFEKKWTQGTDYAWDDLILTRHLEKDGEYGGAYGVLGGHGNLLIIDFDKQWIQDYAYPLLPETFTVKTARKGMYHCYYLIDGEVPKKGKIPDVPRVGPDGKTRESGDLLGHGAQAVGPGSRVFVDDNGTVEERSYDVVRDVPLATVKLEQLQSVIDACLVRRREDLGITEEPETAPAEPSKPKKEKSTIPKNLSEQQAAVVDAIKRNINLREFMAEKSNVHFHDGINGLAECPFHESEGKRNLNISQNEEGHWVWHCFHPGCERGGDIFSFVMEKYDIKFAEAARRLAPYVDLEYPQPAETIDELEITPEQPELMQIQRLIPSVTAWMLEGRKEKATELITDYIEKRHHIKTTKSDASSECWYYDPPEGIYKNSGESEIMRICRLILGINYTKRMAQLVIDKVKADTQISPDEFFNNQNNYPELVCVQNGILNTITKELRPFSPDICFFNHLPVRWDPSKTCPAIIRFLQDILPLEENVLTIQELLGYLLYKRYKYQKAFMFHGPGRNGKSQLLDLMKKLVGDDNFSAISLKQIEEDKFILGNLHNKLVNLSSEITKKALENTGKFKFLTGWDEVEADRKFRETVRFKNYAKLIFATNTLPRLGETDEAFWRRWIMLKFPYRFLPQKDIDAMGLSADELKRQGIKVQIPDIVESIATPDEMSGMLNWALEGFTRLRKQGTFTYSKGLEAMKNEWLAQSNSAHAFIFSTIEYAPDEYVTLEDMKSQYYHFCEQFNVARVSAQEFNKYMSDHTASTQAMPRINGIATRVWRNIRLKRRYVQEIQLDDDGSLTSISL